MGEKNYETIIIFVFTHVVNSIVSQLYVYWGYSV